MTAPTSGVVTATTCGADRRQLLDVLHPTGFRDMRAILKGHKTETSGVPADYLRGVDEFADRYRNRNVYVGVAARIDALNRDTDACLELRALFADIDYKDSSEHDARARLAAFPLAPSAVVASGGGLQTYWFLKEPLDLRNGGAAYAKQLLRALAKTLDADIAAAEPARILRLPGTLNYKYDPPRPVVLERLAEQCVYEMADLAVPLYPALEEVGSDGESAPDSTARRATEHEVEHSVRVEMARAWLNLQRPAIEGEHGDAHTFQVCCGVAVGHDLTADETFNVLREWNARCRPPWSAIDLKAKIQNAIRYAKGTRGEKLRQYPLTEAGDAECFAGLYQDVVRYDHRQGRWLVSDDASGIWLPDPVDRLTQMTVKMMRFRQRQSLAIEDEEKRKAANRWTIAGESRKRLANTIAIARSVPPINDDGKNWDQNPFLLGVQNGVVDLETGQWRKAMAADRVTMRVRVAYDEAATCPLWESTLASIFAPADVFATEESRLVVAFMQRAIGYSITGDCREECCFFTWGIGSNGKGTVMNTLGWLFGDYTDNVPYSTLERSIHGGGIPNDVAKLVGKRYITCSEMNEEFTINEARLKALTGRDPVEARFLYREWFTFIPVGKLWIATNNKPKVVGTDDGIWRRIYLIPFLQQFVEGKPGTPGIINKSLKDQLRNELPGILNWTIAGTRMWLRDGLKPPDTVRAATAAYRNESNPVMSFIDSCCVRGEQMQMQAGPGYTAYETFCKSASIPPWQRLSNKAFAQAMRLMFATVEKRHTFFVGVGLVAGDAGDAGDAEREPGQEG